MPFQNQSNITIRSLGIDYFSWPCMIGEPYAPSLNGGNGLYSTAGIFPAVGNSGSISNAFIVTWGAIPPWRPTQTSFQGLTFSYYLYTGTSVSTNGPRMYLDANSSIDLLVGAPGTITATFDGANTSHTSSTIFQNEWYRFDVTVSSASKVNITVTRVSTGTVLPTSFTNITSTIGTRAVQCQLYFRSNSAGAVNGFASQLNVSYP